MEYYRIKYEFWIVKDEKRYNTIVLKANNEGHALKKFWDKVKTHDQRYVRKVLEVGDMELFIVDFDNGVTEYLAKNYEHAYQKFKKDFPNNTVFKIWVFTNCNKYKTDFEDFDPVISGRWIEL